MNVENFQNKKAEKGNFMRMDDIEASRLLDEKIDEDLADTLEYELFKHYPEIIRALARLVLELRDNIHEYDTVLSDDAGGRLPSLLLKKLIDSKRAEMSIDSTNIYFLDISNLEEIRQLIKDNKNELGKVLVVTEYVESGKKLMSFLRLLDVEDVDFKVVAVSVNVETLDPETAEEILSKVIYGTKDDVGANFWRAQGSGVEKNREEISTHPKRSGDGINNVHMLKKYARNDVAKLAEEFLKLLQTGS